MGTYGLSCKKNTMNKYYNTGKTEHIRLVIISNWAICVKKKTRFIKIKKIGAYWAI